MLHPNACAYGVNSLLLVLLETPLPYIEEWCRESQAKSDLEESVYTPA